MGIETTKALAGEAPGVGRSHRTADRAGWTSAVRSASARRARIEEAARLVRRRLKALAAAQAVGRGD